MEKDTRFCKLGIALKAARYGTSSVQVLRTCELVAQYEEEHTPDQVKEFQEKVSINPQVWARLLALHRDERLKKYQEHLPCTYTTLYAIHRMSDEAVEAAVQQGVIHSGATSHSILLWSKQNRQRSGRGKPPWRCLMVFDQEIGGGEFQVMRWRIDEIAREYGARLMSEWDYIQSESATVDRKQQKIAELERKISELASPVYDAMIESERNNAGVKSPSDFLHIDIPTLGLITRPAYDRLSKGRQRLYSDSYVYRMALEFLKTDSRSQRFNYKRRLKQLAEKQPDLKDLIDEVLETYMK